MLKTVQKSSRGRVVTNVHNSALKAFQKVNDVNIPYRFVSRRPGDNPYVVADNSLAKLILNWEPKFSIDDICRSGWNWQLKNPNGYEN